MNRFFTNIKKLPCRRIAIFALIFWAVVAVFIELAEEVVEKEALPLDIKILQIFSQLNSPFLTEVMVFITHLGGFLAVSIFTVLAAILFWYFKQRQNTVWLLVTMVILGFMNVVLKLVFARVRPELWPHLIEVSSYAFPSGHAMLSSAFAFTMIALFWRSKYRGLIILGAAVYVFLIGFSRLYLGVHYPSDVLGGWMISGAWVLLSLAALKGRSFYLKKYKK